MPSTTSSALTSIFYWAYLQLYTGPEHNLELESIVQFSASTSHRHPALEGATLQQHCFRQIQDPSLCVNKEFFLFVTS
ncbi:hypothetical protein Tco_1081868 [Tanacetum coccineum]|uniref:Uncharacterized protein n=1 Tax=Tanacetum coccineum TaxID=301880 RepID=A0ABQ5I0T0_9ASTR